MSPIVVSALRKNKGKEDRAVGGEVGMAAYTRYLEVAFWRRWYVGRNLKKAKGWAMPINGQSIKVEKTAVKDHEVTYIWCIWEQQGDSRG